MAKKRKVQDEPQLEGRAAYEALNDKQRAFVDEYLIDMIGTQAAIRAGYSKKSAHVQACDLLKHPKIQAALRHKMAEREKRTEITADAVLSEMAKIGFANLRDFVKIDSEGDARPDFLETTYEQWAALGEVTSEVYMEGQGDDAQPVKRTKIKLGDKKGALTELGRHLGLWTDKTEISGPGGKPVEMMVTAQESMAQKLNDLVTKRRIARTD